MTKNFQALTIQQRVASECDRLFVPWDKNLSVPTSEHDSSSLRGEADYMDNNMTQDHEIQSDGDGKRRGRKQSKKSKSTTHSQKSRGNRSYVNTSSLSTTLKDTLSKVRSV